jgi:hypothetical protein
MKLPVFLIRHEDAGGFAFAQPGGGFQYPGQQGLDIRIIRVDKSVNLGQCVKFLNVDG